MSKKQNIPSFTASNLNPKAAKQLADIDKILRKTSDKDKLKLIERGLSVKPLKEDVIKTLDIKKIVRSTSFLRSEVHDPFDDLDMVAPFLKSFRAFYRSLVGVSEVSLVYPPFVVGIASHGEMHTALVHLAIPTRRHVVGE